MNTELNFFEELDLKEKGPMNRTGKPALLVGSLNFKTGLLMGAFCTIVIGTILSFTSFKAEKGFEVVALQLDSIQITQNNRIIELLEKKGVADTTIVHIIAPRF